MRNIKSLLPTSPNLDTGISITPLEPKSDPILILANTNDATTNLIPGTIHGLTNNREKGEEPPFITLSQFGIPLGHGKHEFPPFGVGGIFPHGLYAIAEYVVVGIVG